MNQTLRSPMSKIHSKEGQGAQTQPPSPHPGAWTAEFTLLLGEAARTSFSNPWSPGLFWQHKLSHDASPSTLSHPRSGCLSFLQEVHLKYASRDSLLAPLNLFQALQPEPQLSDSKGGKGRREQTRLSFLEHS